LASGNLLLVLSIVIILTVIASRWFHRRIPVIGRYLYRNIFAYIVIVILSIDFILFPTLLYMFEGFNFFHSYAWIVKATFSVDLPNLPDIRSSHSMFLLFIAGIIGPLSLALFLGIVADIALEKSYLWAVGALTNLREKGYKDHIVFVGLSTTSFEALKELKAMHRNVKVGLVADRSTIENYTGELEELGVEKVAGDPLLEETLDKAAPERARGIIISLDDDLKTFNVLMALVSIIKTRCEENKDACNNPLIVAEVLNHENKSLFENFKNIISKRRGDETMASNIIIVEPRKIGGRLLSSSLVEPLVVDVIVDLLSFKDRFLYLDAADVANLGIAGKTLLKEVDYFYNRGILPIIIEKDGKTWPVKISEPIPDNIIIYYIGVDAPKGKRCRKTQILKNHQALLDIIEVHRTGERGHIIALGYSGAIESFIKEMKNLRNSLPELERIWAGSIGERIANKTFIIVADEEQRIKKLETDSIILIRGSPDEIETLTRVGLAPSDAIVISLPEDARTIRALLNVDTMLTSLKKGSRKPVITEVSKEVIANRILNDGLAHIAVPSRTLAGRMIVHALFNSQKYFSVVDNIVSVRGSIDLQERLLNVQLARALELGCNTETRKIAETLMRRYNSILIGVYEHETGKLCLIPDPDYNVKCDSELIIASISQEESK